MFTNKLCMVWFILAVSFFYFSLLLLFLLLLLPSEAASEGCVSGLVFCNTSELIFHSLITCIYISIYIHAHLAFTLTRDTAR